MSGLSAEEIAERRGEVLARIARACGRVGRGPSEVSLLAVTKSHPAETVRRAAMSGSLPASHSRFCTTMTALGISALPPTWSKWKWELTMTSILAGSRSIASSRALISSPGR